MGTAHHAERSSADLGAILKRYPEPMAHGPEACEPSHPCASCWHRLAAFPVL